MESIIMNILKTLIVTVSVVIAGCGGGGSGGGSTHGGSEGDEFSISFSPSVVNIEETRDPDNYTDIEVRIDYVNEPSGQLYVVLTYRADHLFVSYDLHEEYAELFVRRELFLEPGTYTGDIGIEICSDPDCSKPVGDSPYSLPYNVTVTNPDAQVSVSQANGLAYLMNISDFHRVGVVQPVSSDPVVFNIEITPPHGYNEITLPEELVDLYSVTDLGEGLYQLVAPDPRSLSDSGGLAHESEFDIWFENEIGDQDVTRLEFELLYRETSVESLEVSPEVFLLENSESFWTNVIVPIGQTSFEHEITHHEGDGWLTQHYASSLVRNARGTASFISDSEMLDPGRYSATVTFSSGGAEPAELDVVMAVANIANPMYLDTVFSINEYAVTDEMDLKFAEIPGQPYSWALEASVPWIAFSSSTGSVPSEVGDPSGGDVIVSLISEEIRQLNPFEVHTAYIYLETTLSEGPWFAKELSLEFDLPAVRSAIPTTVAAGEPFTLNVSGKKLLGSTIVVAGEEYFIDTGLPDGTASIEVPGLPAGQYSIRAKNALGMNNGGVSLTVTNN